MQIVLIVIHVIISISLIGIILLQRTNSDGISGLSGGSNSGLISGRAAGNILTKITVILAFLFMVNSLAIGNISNRIHKKKSIIDEVITQELEEKEEVKKAPFAE